MSFYQISIDAVRLQKRVMVEYCNCRKCQKCTDFQQHHPIQFLFDIFVLRQRLQLVLHLSDA